jgi:hypothetical protein
MKWTYIWNALTNLKEIMPKDRLTNNQQLYLDWILEPEDTRYPKTKSAWAEMHEVHYNTPTNWEKMPLFKQLWEEAIKGIAQSPERTQRLLNSLYEKGLNGDVKAAQLYLTATGAISKDQHLTIKHENAKDLSDLELQDLIAQFATNEQATRMLDKSNQDMDVTI